MSKQKSKELADKEEVVEQLLQRGASVDLQDSSSGDTALMAAVVQGHPAIVRRLLQAGAQLGLRNCFGENFRGAPELREAAAAAGVALLWEPRAARPKERAYSEEDIIAGV